MGDQPPREVEDAEQALGVLFGNDDPDAGAEARLWNRIQRDLGPQARPWYRRLGSSGGAVVGFPLRRAALVGITAAAMIAAVLIVPSLGGNSASAQILDAVDDLSAATSAALSDNSLTDDELTSLREQADALLLRLEDDPTALANLDLADLSAAIASLQAVEALLVEQRGPASAVVTPLGQATQQVEHALLTRDPNNPLLAATVTSDETVIPAAEGRRSFAAADAGTVVIDVRTGSLALVAARPAAGWTAIPEETGGEEVEVRFRAADGRQVELEVELDDGLLETSLRFSGNSSSGSDDDDDDRDDDRDDDGPSATGTPGATSTAGATSTPGASSTPGAGSRGSIPANQSGLLQLAVGTAGSVVIDVTGGLRLVSATPNPGWTLVRQDVDDDDIDVRFAQGTTEWRIDLDEDDDEIEWQISRHLNETSSSGSDDDFGDDDDDFDDDDSDDDDDFGGDDFGDDDFGDDDDDS